MKSDTKRLYLIDYARGVGIVFVVIYHLLFDLQFIFGLPMEILNWDFIDFGRDIIITGLILVSGISCSFSKNNLIRGLKLLVVALLITFATYYFVPQQMILFGIIHFFALSILITTLFMPILDAIKPIHGVIIFGALFFCLKFLGLMDMFVTDEANFVYFMAGLTSYPYYSADYWPIFPWIFAFISGIFCGKIIVAKPPEILKWNKIPALGFIGRHTLAIYIVHQPILLGILGILL